jgi:hypothetical protein
LEHEGVEVGGGPELDECEAGGGSRDGEGAGEGEEVGPFCVVDVVGREAGAEVGLPVLFDVEVGLGEAGFGEGGGEAGADGFVGGEVGGGQGAAAVDWGC